jgi:hypothetical protein
MTKPSTKAQKKAHNKVVQAMKAANTSSGSLAAILAKSNVAGLASGGAKTTIPTPPTQQLSGTGGTGSGGDGVAGGGGGGGAGLVAQPSFDRLHTKHNELKGAVAALEAKFTTMANALGAHTSDSESDVGDTVQTAGGTEGKRLVDIKEGVLSTCGAEIIPDGSRFVAVSFKPTPGAVAFAGAIIDYRNRLCTFPAMLQRLIYCEQDRLWAEVLSTCALINTGTESKITIPERGYHCIFDAMAAYFIKTTTTQVTFGSALVAIMLAESDISTTTQSQLKSYSSPESPMAFAKLLETHLGMQKIAISTPPAAAARHDFFAFATVSEPGHNRFRLAVKVGGQCDVCFAAHTTKECPVKFGN